MALLTRQDVIAKVREHFSRPEAQLAVASGYGETYETADEGEGPCVYRMDGDPSSPVRCAMGVLIPNDRYLQTMEGRSAHVLLDGFTTEAPNSPWDLDAEEIAPEERTPPVFVCLADLFARDVDGPFLSNLQTLHDSTAHAGLSVGEFLDQLGELERSL